jgi:hypothetical protein
MLLGDAALARELTAQQSLDCLGKGFIQERSVNKDPASVYQSMNEKGVVCSRGLPRLCYGILCVPCEPIKDILYRCHVMMLGYSWGYDHFILHRGSPAFSLLVMSLLSLFSESQIDTKLSEIRIAHYRNCIRQDEELGTKNHCSVC